MAESDPKPVEGLFKGNNGYLVVIVGAVLAGLYFALKGSGTSSTAVQSSVPTQAASTIASENVAANQTAANETVALAQTASQYQQNVNNNATSLQSQTIAGKSAQQLAQIQYETTVSNNATATGINASNNQALVQDTASTNAANENIANTVSSNQVNAVRASANAQKDSSIFGSLTGFLGGLFNGGLFGGGSSSGSAAFPTTAAGSAIPNPGIVNPAPTAYNGVVPNNIFILPTGGALSGNPAGGTIA